MNHSTMSSMHLNRPATRRLHRRFAPAVASRPCVAPERAPAAATQTLVGLPREALREAGMLELVAAELRIAELEKALEEARNTAFADPLTGALNRRGFEKAYQREIARFRRSGSRLALVMIDIDNFKSLNDTYGHLAGDRVLVHLVDILQESMRPSDVLCRFGGEEFVLMLPDTSVEDAGTAVGRFLTEFSSRMIPDVDKAVTFSAGVIGHDYFESLDEAVQRADTATYAAKKAGKNRIVIA